MASQPARLADVPPAPAVSPDSSDQVIHLDDLRNNLVRKPGRRSLSSFSGYLDNPSQQSSSSLEHLHRSSSLSRMPETPQRNGSRGWTIPWRWLRMRKAYQRKLAAEVTGGRSSSSRFNRRFMTSSLAVDQTFSSNDLSIEEGTGSAIKDNIFRNDGRDSEHTNSSLSLCLKYQPKVFEDIIGHQMTMKSISTAIHRKRISSLYLFHGPSGTGKSCTARILATVLNCESGSLTRPCWSCRGCSRSLYAMEMCSGSRLSGFEKVKTLIQNTLFTQAMPGLKPFILEECHVLTVEAWDELLSIVEGPNGSSMVFILVTAKAERLPALISSRCQKYCFPKLTDEEVERKLTRIAAGEGIRIEKEAMELITAKAGGSLREAESILDQLTLFDRSITTSMVQQIVHLIPREKLNQLLMAALSGDTTKTIKLATELIGSSGVEPQALMSQLASLIKNQLSTSAVTASGSSSTASASCRQEKMCYALKVFVGLEKQSRSFIDLDTQIFAALVQIASPDAPKRTSHRSKDAASHEGEGDEVKQELLEAEKQILHTKEYDPVNDYTTPMMIEGNNTRSREKAVDKGSFSKSVGIRDIEEIWLNMVDNVLDRDMKEFLSRNVKLASLTISSANAIVHLMFRTQEDRTRAEMSEESISSALQIAIGCPVTVNVSVQPLDLRCDEHDMDFVAETRQAECSHRSRNEERTWIHQNNIHSASFGVSSPQVGSIVLASHNSHSQREVGKPSVLSSQRLSISERPLQERQPNIEASRETRGMSQSARVYTSTRDNHPNHRWVSASSIVQSDASVEPYSQDILFECANQERESKARKNPKVRNRFPKVQEEHHPQLDGRIEGLDRSWSCMDMFFGHNRNR